VSATNFTKLTHSQNAEFPSFQHNTNSNLHPYLNEGAELFCANKATNKATKYCEFEWFFIDDLSRALGINFDQIQVSERSERSELLLITTTNNTTTTTTNNNN